METTIRLDESRVVNGWIKTTDDGYISEDAIVEFRISVEPYDDTYRSFNIVAIDNRGERTEVGYYPYITSCEKAVAEGMAKKDLDTFVATHGRLF